MYTEDAIDADIATATELNTNAEELAPNASKKKGNRSSKSKSEGDSTMSTENATPAATPAPTEKKKRVLGPRPILPKEHVFDVGGINTEFATIFGGQLLEAMSAVVAGEVVVAATPLIDVEYVQDTTNTQKQNQTFAVIMGTGFPEGFSILEMLNPASETPNTSKLEEALDMFKNVDVSNLQIIPITGTALNPALNVMLQIRGQMGDKHPMIVNSKPLPRVYARIEDGALKWFSMDGVILTEHQQKILTKRFGEGITSALTPQMLSDVFKGTAAKFLIDMTNVAPLRKQLDVIEGLAEKYLAS